jgi:hypothetical protein
MRSEGAGGKRKKKQLKRSFLGDLETIWLNMVTVATGVFKNITNFFLAQYRVGREAFIHEQREIRYFW